MPRKKTVPLPEQRKVLDLARKHGLSVEIVADIIEEAQNGSE